MVLPKYIRQAILEGGASEENTQQFLRWVSQYVTQCKKANVPVRAEQVLIVPEKNERCLLFFSLLKQEEPLRSEGDARRSNNMACVIFCEGATVPTPMELYAELYILYFFNFYKMLLPDIRDHEDEYEQFWPSAIEEGVRKGLSIDDMCNAAEKCCREFCTIGSYLTPLYTQAIKDHLKSVVNA